MKFQCRKKFPVGLSPFIASSILHGLVLAAALYAGQYQIPMNSYGDLTVELIGVEGGQDGQQLSQESEPNKKSGPLEAKIFPEQQPEKDDVLREVPKLQENKTVENRARKNEAVQDASQGSRSEAEASSGLAGRPGSAGGGSSKPTYIQSLYTSLEKNKNYPMLAKNMRLEGVVKVGFRVLRDGTIKNIEIKQPCGSEVLNNAAIRTLEKVSGQWPLPESIKDDYLVLDISFNYQMI